MITEKEKNDFNVLRRILLANGMFLISWDEHLEGSDLDIENVISNVAYDYSSYPSRQIEIPEIIVQSLISFANREIMNSFQDAEDEILSNNNIENDPRTNFELIFDCKRKLIQGKINVSFEATADSEYEEWNVNDNEFVQGIFDSFDGSDFDCAELTVNYYGGGDSGSIDDCYCDGDYKSDSGIPNEVENFIYDNLPGGWEINEGSSGSYKFDFVNKQIEHTHTDYYEENISKTFFEENF